MSRVHAAVVATEELERLLELGATEEGTELLVTATLDDEGAIELEDDERLDDDGAIELGELELVGVTVPQPIGWVDTTISSIHTSAVRLLKLWKPNITKLNLSLIQPAPSAPLFQSAPEVTE